MKTFTKALLATAALGASALFAQAQPALKVATIDMTKAMNAYYRTQEEQAKLQAYEQAATKDTEKLVAEGREMASQFQSQVEITKSSMASEDARKRAQEDAQRLAAGIQRKEQEINQYHQQAIRNIQQSAAASRQILIEEINKVATDIGKKKGATILLEKGAFIYGDTTYDITDDVIAEINKNKPAAPAAAPAPAVNFPAK